MNVGFMGVILCGFVLYGISLLAYLDYYIIGLSIAGVMVSKDYDGS